MTGKQGSVEPQSRSPHESHEEHSQALFSAPCALDVRKMPRTGRGHYCSQCRKSVMDTANMSVDEAARLVRGTDDVCVSYSLVEDGRLVFRSRGSARLAISLAAFLAACTAPEAPDHSVEAESQEQTAEDRTTEHYGPEDRAEFDNTFAPVEPSITLNAPTLPPPEDTCDESAGSSQLEGTSASPGNGKRHLPVAASAPSTRQPLPPPPPLPGRARPPRPRAGKPVRSSVNLAGGKGPPPATAEVVTPEL